MFDTTRFALFLTAAVLLAIAPGPGMLYVLARSLAGGRREGVLSALGTFLGGMVHVFAAALGVSIILAKSALAFATVKYVGRGLPVFSGLADDSRCAQREGECGADSWRRHSFDCEAGAKSAVAGRGDGSAQSQDCFVFSLLHSAVRDTEERACFPAIRGAGNNFGGNEYDGGPDRDCPGGAFGRTDSLLGNFPAPAKNRDWRDHDWAGNVSRD